MTFGKNEYLLSFWEETAKFFLLGGGGGGPIFFPIDFLL